MRYKHNTKLTSPSEQDVSEKLANASETNKRINEACEEYRPVAHRATLIYFLIAEFSVVNCMYQTSLAQFNQLYELVSDGEKCANLQIQDETGRGHSAGSSWADTNSW